MDKQLSKKEQQRLKRKYGEWAIVTGASSGIGLALSTQLAAAGFNLLLVARTAAKLQAVTQALQQQYSVTIKAIAADVAEPDGRRQIMEASEGLQTGLLIHSAGFGTSGLFTEASINNEVEMLRVNCEAVLLLSHWFGKIFQQQNRGGIIFLSSLVAFQGVPYSANYAATKAYVQSFAEAFAIEMKPFGVDILSAAPGPVNSGFGERARMNMGRAMDPSAISVPILQALGRSTTVVPGILSKVLVYALRTVPRWAKVRIMKQVMLGFTRNKTTNPYFHQ